MKREIVYASLTVCVFIGVGIKQTVQRAVEAVGITGIESQRISGRMLSYIISSRADNTSKMYMNRFKRF